MKREQVVFLSAGILLGFVIGFVVAWGIRSAPVAQAAMPRQGAPMTSMPAAGAATSEQAMGGVTARLNELKQRIEEHPDDVGALVELSTMYIQVSMYDQARGYLERAETIAPDDVHVLKHLGIVLGQVGSLPEARARFERVVQLDPESWDGWFYLAVTAARQGDLQAMRTATARVEELNPDLPELADLRQHLAHEAATE